MRFAPLAAAAAVLALLAPPPAHALRAMSWNIAGSPVNARGHFGVPFSLIDVEAVVGHEHPDVLALQEACSWEAAAIARDLGYTAWHAVTIAGFTDTRPGAGGRCDYGDALLVRPPTALTGPVRTDLLTPGTCKSDARQSGLPECRVVMSATLTADGGVRVTNTHVGIDPNQSTELATLRRVAAALPPPAIVMGDDNVQSQDPRLGIRLAALGYLDAAGAIGGLPCAAVVGCRDTFPSGGVFGAPNVKGDDLFVRGLRASRSSGPVPVTVAGRQASDHLALVADLSPAAPTGAFGLPAASPRAVARRGLHFVLGASEAVRADVTVRLTPASAHRLGLAHRALATGRAVIAGAGAGRRLTLRVDTTAARALRRAASATITVAVRLVDAQHRVGRVPQRTIRLSAGRA